MKASELIKEIEKASNEDTMVCLKSFDLGGDYNERRFAGLQIEQDDDDGTYLINSTYVDKEMTVKEVVDMLKDFIQEYGDQEIGIKCGDSGGDYYGHSEDVYVMVNVETNDEGVKQLYVILGA